MGPCSKQARCGSSDKHREEEGCTIVSFNYEGVTLFCSSLKSELLFYYVSASCYRGDKPAFELQ